MNRTEIDVMLKAKSEILTLRRQNEILRAKVEVMDLFAVVLHSHPASRGECAMGVDVAWEIDKALAEDKKQQAEEASAASEDLTRTT